MGPDQDDGRDFSLSHAELSALWRLWTQVRGGRAMPSRQDFTPERLRPWLGNLALIDVRQEPTRLQYRLVGTIIVANLKFDPTGKLVDDLVVDPVNNPLTRGLYHCLSTGAPVFEVVQPQYNRHFAYDYHRLALPLAADGETVNMILMGEYVIPRPRLTGREGRGGERAIKIWI
jgi:hypothetical protein